MSETVQQSVEGMDGANGPVHRMGQAGRTEMCGQNHDDGQNHEHSD